MFLRSSTATLGWATACVLLAACATGGRRASAPGQASSGRDELAPGWNPGQGPPEEKVSEGRGGGMKIEVERGYLSQEDAEDPIHAQWPKFVRCYDRAGPAQRYAEGRVLLRFHIAADGHPEDVRVIESTLGNWDVERCLVATGRQLRFPKPEGAQGTAFEFPVDFSSRREFGLLDGAGTRAETDVAAAAAKIESCPCFGEADGEVLATVYVEPGGVVGSVGLAAEARLDEPAGLCLVRALLGKRTSADFGRRAARFAFPVPAAPACQGQ